MHNIESLKLPWLLVATPQLIDPNFKRKIVLIVEHGSHGSMGFVINQPLRTPLADLVLDEHMNIPRHIPAWYGGPVQEEQGIILHESSEAPEGVYSVNSPQQDQAVEYSGYALSTSESMLAHLILQLDATHRDVSVVSENPELTPSSRLYPFRFLVGYAGWRKGQLEREIRDGAWIQIPASPKLVFDTPWPEMWNAALSHIGVNPRAIAPAASIFIN